MTYKVLDTNLILLDAHNIVNLGKDGSIIVLPETVLDEIDSKKSGHTELAFQAREFGRLLSKATKISSNKIEDLNITILQYEDITLHVVSISTYPDFKDSSPNIINDRKIIEVATQYHNIFTSATVSVIFISNDVMCRLRADSLGLQTADLKEVEHTNFEFTKTLDLPMSLFVEVHDKPIDLIDPDYKTEYYNYVFTSPDTSQVKLAYINPNGLIKVIGKETEKEIRDTSRQLAPPINSEQLMLSRAILDQSIDIIVCESLAGSGKTITALSNAMRLVGTNSPYESITYIRASVSDLDAAEEVGFLPGLEEKFAPYLHPVKDSLDFIARRQHPRQKSQKISEYEEAIEKYIEDLHTRYNITAMTGLGLRGRTFNNSIIIIDEAQNMSKASLQKVLTRIGKHCKVIIIGSNKQIDNPYVNKFNNGLSVILNDCTKQSDLVRKYAITLHRVVRSPLTEWAEEIFSS